jgi:hypothetical protein
MSPIWLIVILLAFIAVLLLASAIGSFRSSSRLRGSLAVLVAALVLAVGAVAGTAAWSLASFQMLTREATAATIEIEPRGNATFLATVLFTGGGERRFVLRGDQVYVDALIVKLHPWANAIGLPTGYRLERIGGRYRSLDDERAMPRTVELLSDEVRPGFAADAYDWLTGQDWLRPLIDARYGSGTFLAADAPKSIEVRVSTTGLLMRER